MRNFRYARARVINAILISAALACGAGFVLYMLLPYAGVQPTTSAGIVGALVFFGACSANMIWRFVIDDVVLAIRPDGIVDRRISPEVIRWEDIKEIRFERAENDFFLRVYLWPQAPVAGSCNHRIETAMLDGSIEQITDAISHRLTVTSGSIPTFASRCNT